MNSYIYLLPFINTFLLYIFIEEGQLFSNVYRYFKERVAPRLPIPFAILGGCILCTSTWMGIIEVICISFLNKFAATYLLIIAYNAVSTSILYRLLK